MSSSGNAGFKCNPAGIASHDLHHHDAVMRFGGGVDLVHRISSGGDCGIEAESDFGCGKIVVDRFGHAHDLHAALEKLQRDGLRALAADADYGIDSQLAGVGDDFIGNIASHFFAVLDGAVFEWIAAIGGAKNGAAARQNAAYMLQCEFVGFFRPDQSVEAVRDADDLPFVFQEGAFTAARITALRPGASPPPVQIPMQRMSVIAQ